MLLADDFFDGDFAGWTVVDEGQQQGSSDWKVALGRFLQSSNILGPAPTSVDHRQGTFAFWNHPAALEWTNYSFALTLRTADDDGLGVLFRYQNPSNYYKVELDSQRSFRKLLKMTGGVETTLATAAGGYVLNTNLALRVDVSGSQITVTLDGVVLFGGPVSDSDLATGTVALYCWGSTGATFDNIVAKPPNQPPVLTLFAPANETTFPAFASIGLVAGATNFEIQLNLVEFFDGDTLLAGFISPPFVFTWTNASFTNHLLTARATDSQGAVTVSAPVIIHVVYPPPATLLDPPQSQSVVSNSSFYFRSRAAGSPDLRYQWRFDGVDLDGATNRLLYFNSAQAAQAGAYRVVVFNLTGSDTSAPAVLTVVALVSNVVATNAPPPRIANLEQIDQGQFLLTLTAPLGAAVVLQASANLQDWSPLITLTNSGGTHYYFDPAAVHSFQRFYRAILGP